MLKSLQTIKNRNGRLQKMATLICENCNKEFDVPEKEYLRGRKYCDKVCSDEGRHFEVEKVAKIKK